MAEYDYEGVRRLEFFKDKDLSYAFDSMTKVFDRENITGYIRWLAENNRPFSLFIVDVDNFKNVNDTYGHQVGDIALIEVATYLLSRVYGKGVVGRYGGDEFFIVFEDVIEYEEVWEIGHSIDMEINSINIEGCPRLSLTVSIGIARFPLDATDYDNLVLLADKALYRAKTKGRNCFIIYLASKHAHLTISKSSEKQMSTMQLAASAFNCLTAFGEDIVTGIKSLFRSLVSFYMFDHICIESPKKKNFDVVYELSEVKEFSHFPYEIIAPRVNASGYFAVSNTKNLKESVAEDFIAECRRQSITATYYAKISAYGKDYGYIRVDSAQTTRIWQPSEMTNLITAANAIGLILYYQHKNLDDLPDTEQIEILKTE